MRFVPDWSGRRGRCRCRQGSESPAAPHSVEKSVDYSNLSWSDAFGEAINATFQKQRFPTRAPVGTEAAVGFVPRTVTLTAADDGYETLARTSIFLGCQVNDGRAGSSGALKAVIANETVTRPHSFRRLL